jgi:hypothetical protein
VITINEEKINLRSPRPSNRMAEPSVPTDSSTVNAVDQAPRDNKRWTERTQDGVIVRVNQGHVPAAIDHLTHFPGRTTFSHADLDDGLGAGCVSLEELALSDRVLSRSGTKMQRRENRPPTPSIFAAMAKRRDHTD